MDKFLYLISEGLKNVWRHKMTTFTAVFSLILALYFVGLLATAGENTKSILQYLRSKYKRIVNSQEINCTLPDKLHRARQAFKLKEIKLCVCIMIKMPILA